MAKSSSWDERTLESLDPDPTGQFLTPEQYVHLLQLNVMIIELGKAESAVDPGVAAALIFELRYARKQYIRGLMEKARG